VNLGPHPVFIGSVAEVMAYLGLCGVADEADYGGVDLTVEGWQDFQLEEDPSAS